MKWSVGRSVLPLVSLILAIRWSLTLASGGRTQYHEQGLHGHASYKFGFETGDHYNPQSRHEESDGHGNVHGHYSYVDGKGKKITVYYKSDKNGFYRSDDPANAEKEKKWHKKSHHHHKHHEKHHWKGAASAASPAVTKPVAAK